MKTFETATIDTTVFFNITLIEPIKMIAGSGVVIFLIWLIARTFFDVEDIGPVKRLPHVLLLLVKAFFYGILSYLVFFYDFSTSTAVWQFPKEISISSAFVGTLSAYEAISGLASAFTVFLGK